MRFSRLTPVLLGYHEMGYHEMGWASTVYTMMVPHTAWYLKDVTWTRACRSQSSACATKTDHRMSTSVCRLASSPAIRLHSCQVLCFWCLQRSCPNHLWSLGCTGLVNGAAWFERFNVLHETSNSRPLALQVSFQQRCCDAPRCC